jgi:Family of unknown function (DUF5313)
MTYDRWMRQAYRSFPQRWRAERGEELLDTAAALAPPGAGRPAIAVLLDVIGAGLRERHRTRPPFHRWLRYALGGKLARPWHPWMRDDLTGRWFWLRHTFRNVALSLLPMIIAMVHNPNLIDGWLSVAMVAVVLALGRLSAGFHRRLHWERNGYEPSGETWARPGRFVWITRSVQRPTASHPIAPTCRWMGCAAIVTSTGWFCGAAYRHPTLAIGFLTFHQDPNSPIQRYWVGRIGVASLVLAFALGALAAWRLPFVRVAADRMPLDTGAPRRRGIAHIAGIGTLTLIGLVGATSTFPALATAAVGAALLVIGGCATTAGFLRPHLQTTWGDLLVRQGRAATSLLPAERR